VSFDSAEAAPLFARPPVTVGGTAAAW